MELTETLVRQSPGVVWCASGMSPESQRRLATEIAAAMAPMTLTPGESLWSEHDASEEFYFLCRGELVVHPEADDFATPRLAPSAESLPSEPVVGDIYVPGSLVGLTAFLQRARRAESVAAGLDGATLFAMRTTAWEALRRQRSEVLAMLMSVALSHAASQL